MNVADVWVVLVKNGVNGPPSSETKTSYEEMLLAPALAIHSSSG